MQNIEDFCNSEDKLSVTVPNLEEKMKTKVTGTIEVNNLDSSHRDVTFDCNI